MTNLELAKEQGNQSAPNVIDAAKASEVQIDVTLAQEQGNQAAPLIADSLANSELYDAIKQQGNQAMPLIIDALTQPAPYTPAPWLRVTGGEYTVEEGGQSFTLIGGSVSFMSEGESPLQYSNDRVSWIDMDWTFSEDGNFYVSEIFELGNNEQVYFRASEKIELFNAALPFTMVLGGPNDESHFPGVFSLDGNYNSLYGPSAEEWETIIPENYIDSVNAVVLHIPDFPGTVLPQDADYEKLKSYFSFSLLREVYKCPVSDDGETFNFKLGIIPDELYEAGLILFASNFFMADFLGNSQGLIPPDTCVLTTSPSVSGPLDNFINPTLPGLNMPYLIGIINDDNSNNYYINTKKI